MLTLNQCKKILNENENLYTDEEIILIRDWLYRIADIAINSSEASEEKKEEIINTKQKRKK